MMGYTHMLIGFGTGLVLKNHIGPLGVMATCIGSLLPDIDYSHSILGKRFPLGEVIGGRHRGWVHSIFGLLVFSALAAFIHITVFPGIFLGYLLHLIADSLNPTGIAWLYPLRKKYYSIAKIKTGSVYDYLIATIAIIGIFFYFV